MSELHLLETKHPNAEAKAQFESLVGIDEIKQSLVDELVVILDRARLDKWRAKHHPKGLGILDSAKSKAPLILLSGEVGCGKTALASSVASATAKLIDQTILCLETPSDIRGGGHVGELSSRVTEAFRQAAVKASAAGRAILVIDEADDLATRRSQVQAHHEDRAGVNVLIKQIDQLARNTSPMAVIMITNRADILDPTVVRRAALHLQFERPNEKAREAIFRRLLDGAKVSDAEIQELVELTKNEIPYTFSDLTDRIARVALRQAWKSDSPFGVRALKRAIKEVKPSPLMGT